MGFNSAFKGLIKSFCKSVDCNGSNAALVMNDDLEGNKTGTVRIT